MAHAPTMTGTVAGRPLRAWLETKLAAFGRGLNAYMEARSRRDQVEQLNALSDAELARLGITRDGIVRYVFRDVFYS